MFTIVDQYHGDPLYAQLHVLTREYPHARVLLKTAAFEENKNKVASLPSTAFAWESERRFPLHTKEDAIASIFYRSKCAFHVPAHVDEKLAAAAQIYRLPKNMFTEVKQASTTPTEYALPEEKRLPIMGPLQIKMAEEVLHRDYRKLPLEKRAEAFQNLFKAARRYQVQLEPLSLKMAGVTGCDTRFLRAWLEARVEAAEAPAHKLAYEKLAAGLTKTASLVSERATLVKLASTIAALDAHAGLARYYDKKLPDPLLTVFNREKVAEELIDLPGGSSVPVSTLMNLPREVWEQVDAPELADVAAAGNPTQFGQVFETLPLDVKMMLQGQLHV